MKAWFSCYKPLFILTPSISVCQAAPGTLQSTCIPKNHSFKCQIFKAIHRGKHLNLHRSESWLGEENKEKVNQYWLCQHILQKQYRALRVKAVCSKTLKCSIKTQLRSESSSGCRAAGQSTSLSPKAGLCFPDKPGTHYLYFPPLAQHCLHPEPTAPGCGSCIYLPAVTE